MMRWKVAEKELIELLGKTIYKPENVLVEIAANSYDADASIVKIISSGETKMIQVLDNGCGMDRDDLEILITIAKSKKKELSEQGIKTPKYNRKYLGSFGIGIISFLSLGNNIRIFTKKEGCTPLFVEIKRETDSISDRTSDIPISDITESIDFNMHLINGLETVSGTTIEIENTKLDFSENYQLLRHKLSNLPIYDDFKIFLNNSEIKKEDYPINSWENKSFTISLEDVDPEYISRADIHVYYNLDNPNETLALFKRGIYLKVHGRIIEHNLYQMFRDKLTSPAAIDSRLMGVIEADYLFNKIQANREDFFEDKLILKICEQLRPQVQNIINDYLLLKNMVSEEAYLNEFRVNKEKAIERIQNVHQELLRHDVKFKYTPETEQELVVLIVELCSKNILEFEIIKINSNSHIDCLVMWPITQTKRIPDFVGHLEIETSLHKFFLHQHDYRTKPEICCWDINVAAFNREASKYKRNRPESIEDILLVLTPREEDKNHFHHQAEVHVKIRQKHDESVTKILRVYVISQIIREH